VIPPPIKPVSASVIPTLRSSNICELMVELLRGSLVDGMEIIVYETAAASQIIPAIRMLGNDSSLQLTSRQS
jgi:hypothetical protein